MFVSAHKQRLTVQGTMVRFQDAYKEGLHGAGGCLVGRMPTHTHTPRFDPRQHKTRQHGTCLNPQHRSLEAGGPEVQGQPRLHGHRLSLRPSWIT